MTGRTDYQKKLQSIFDKLVLMCRHAEAIVEKSAAALLQNDLEITQEIYAEEKIIDKLERKIEKACLRLLVMEHPVASDFREISAALKIITDLERIGDQAKDIAKIAKQIKNFEQKIPQNIAQMSIIIVQMVKDCVAAYINRDALLAKAIDETDDKADALFKIIIEDLVLQIKESPQNAKYAMLLMMSAKYLERIGDHSVNIGKWVVYSVTGSYPK
jgi:phosphate transport system protein